LIGRLARCNAAQIASPHYFSADLTILEHSWLHPPSGRRDEVERPGWRYTDQFQARQSQETASRRFHAVFQE
jgi:hypothetical protein